MPINLVPTVASKQGLHMIMNLVEDARVNCDIHPMRIPNPFPEFVIFSYTTQTIGDILTTESDSYRLAGGY